jgi:orotate phosphoribosyltransferase
VKIQFKAKYCQCGKYHLVMATDKELASVDDWFYVDKNGDCRVSVVYGPRREGIQIASFTAIHAMYSYIASVMQSHGIQLRPSETNGAENLEFHIGYEI